MVIPLFSFHTPIPPLHADASSHCRVRPPQVTSMCLSKGLRLIPRAQKGIIAVKYMASATEQEHWRWAEPTRDSWAPARVELG